MAPARSAARAHPRPSRPASTRPRVIAGTGARGIRWDRVSRVGLLVVLVGIVALYIGPAHSYVSTLREAKVKRAEVHRLQRENAHLRARRDALRDPKALEREARRLGMVKPGERAYVVKGLPKGR
jgi:cell division protein FtsB